jgi:hypothetical protein
LRQAEGELILSMPAGWPRLDDLLHRIDYGTNIGFPLGAPLDVLPIRERDRLRRPACCAMTSARFA